MKCADCVYLKYEYVCGAVLNSCKCAYVYVPPAAGYELIEHECDFFTEKSGISKWDSYSDEEKKEILAEFDKMYRGNDKSFDEIRNTYTFEEAKEMFIENMKNTDKNAKYRIREGAKC